MKLSQIIEPNAGDGFALVELEIEVDGQPLLVDFFVNAETGMVEPHKNTASELMRGLEYIVKARLPDLSKELLAQTVGNEIKALETRLATLKKVVG